MECPPRPFFCVFPLLEAVGRFPPEIFFSSFLFSQETALGRCLTPPPPPPPPPLPPPPKLVPALFSDSSVALAFDAPEAPRFV